MEFDSSINNLEDSESSLFELRSHLLSIDSYFERLEDPEIVFLVFFGHVNAGKSSLIKDLCGKITKVSLRANYNLPEIDFYWTDSNPNLIYVDTAGFILGKQSGNCKTDMENFIDDLTKSVKKNFLLLRTDLNETLNFSYVYILLESNGNLSKHYILALDYLHNSRKLWFLLVSKIDARLVNYKDDLHKMAFIEKRRKEIMIQLRCIPKHILKSRLHFVSTITKFSYCNWNQLNDFKFKLENYRCLQYSVIDNENDSSQIDQNLTNLDIDINIGVFGGGNIGKSSLIKLITDYDDIEIGDGITTKEIKCYYHPEHWIIQFFDTPGDDGFEVSVDIDNATHSFDIIFLLLNDSVTESDLKLVDDIKMNNLQNEKKIKLFVLKTFFDVDYHNKVDIEIAKLLHKSSHLGQLGLPDDTPFYCVSLNPKYQDREFNSDLNQFLSDWFQLGLSESQKNDCKRVSYKTTVTEYYISETQIEMDKSIRSLTAGSFFWNLIPVFGIFADKAFIKKFIKRYAILLKLHESNDGKIREHYEKIKLYRQDKLSEEIENIEFKYLNLNKACDYVYNQALDNFGRKFPAFKSLTTIFRFDNPLDISLRTLTEISLRTLTGLLVTLIDDMAREIPKIMTNLGFLGMVGAGVSVAFCFTAVFHIYLLAREIPSILIKDAKTVYIFQKN